jgi:hypothetical protein
MDVECEEYLDQDYTSESDKETFLTLDNLKEIICNDIEAVWKNVIIPYTEQQHCILQNLSNNHFSSFFDMIVNNNSKIKRILNSN